MVSSISDEEFHRLQIQLLELRTENYGLSDRCRRQEIENATVKEKLDSVEKELQRANKALAKSKKATEFSLLLQDNESLQRKLQSQEEEFRLQNNTLMVELSSLVKRNEELEALEGDDKTSRKPSAAPAVDTAQIEEEVRRLRAANAALQCNIDEIKGKFEAELKLLRSAIDSVDITDSSPSSYESHDASLSNLINDSVVMSKLNDLKLAADTEREENRLLKQRITQLEKTSSAEAVEKLLDKLKRKQESYIQLQSEKEVQYEETSKRIAFLEEARQRDIKGFHSQIEKLKEDVSSAQRDTLEASKLSEQKSLEYQATIKALKTKVNEVSLQKIDSLNKELEQARVELESISANLVDYQSQLEETSRLLGDRQNTLTRTEKQLESTSARLSETETKLADVTQIAEKRKKLLDELAIKCQEDSEGFKAKFAHHEQTRRQELEAVMESHRSEINNLSKLLRQEQGRSNQLEKCRQELEGLMEQNRLLLETKVSLETSLQDKEVELAGLRESHHAELSTLNDAFKTETSRLAAVHAAETLRLTEAFQNAQLKLEQANKETETLQQKVKDNEQEMRLHEKKGAGLLKDLKRQLAQETRRADKLEQRVQELGTENSIKAPSESFFLPIDVDRSPRHAEDASSVSSWSGANYSAHGSSGAGCRDTAAKHSNSRGSPQPEHELGSLLILVESLQKEKAALSERVSILEQSNCAMAEDMLQKQAIIEFYTMEGKEYHKPTSKFKERMTLKRVVEFVKDKGDETLMEKYRKCQRMLEETLTKNMCLQNDLEALSSEIALLKSEKRSNS